MNVLVALCAIGAEKVLGNEIRLSGWRIVSSEAGRVAFEGDDDALFNANLCLATADRVYLQAAYYQADDFDDLFDGAYSVEWQDLLKKNSRVVIDKARSRASRLNSERAIQSVIQKAIYTKLTDKWHIGTLSESGFKSDVRVYIEKNKARVLLDLSGEPLHKRGYRLEGGDAPLRETTAAVLLHMMMWKRKLPLHDPFCGSGTIAIEAALYAHNIAPGLARAFAVENLPFLSKQKASELRLKQARKIRADSSIEVRVTGTDISGQAVALARKNAERAFAAAKRALKAAGSEQEARFEVPDFQQADFRELRAPFERGMLICNPPYGERLGSEEQAERLYKEMSSLFEDFSGWKIGVITENCDFPSFAGRRADSVKPLKSGKKDTAFYIYENQSERNPKADSHRRANRES